MSRNRLCQVVLTVSAVVLGMLTTAGPAQAASPTITTSAGTVTSSSAMLNWDYTAGDRTVDFIRVGRTGTDASGAGPWFKDYRPPADGSLQFTNLKSATSYTLYAELWRGSTKLVQSSVPVTTSAVTAPAGTPFGYGATGATSTTVRATLAAGSTEVAINTAITNASNAGGGIVQLSAGTYTSNGRIINRSNVKLRGPAVPTGTQPTAIIKAGPSFLTSPVNGGYSMLTNSSGASNMTVEDILFDQSGNTLNGNVTGRLSAYLVETRNATNVVFDQVWTRNPFTYSIAVLGGNKVGVRNSDTRVDTAGKYDQLDGIHVLGSDNVDIVDNHVDQGFSGALGDGDDGLVAHTIGSPTTHVNYLNNWVHGGRHGHGLQLAGGTYDITDIVIQGNTFDCTNATDEGIRFGYYGTATSKVDRVTIGGAPGKSNRFVDCRTSVVDLDDGPVWNANVQYNSKDVPSGPYLVPAGNGNIVANNTIN